jgi:hypothetical protein
MGRMVDVSYAMKVQRGDHELVSGDRFQRETYRKAHINAMNIRLWLEVQFLCHYFYIGSQNLQNGQQGLPLTIDIPTFPYFHPKDSEPILSLAAPHTLTTYSYWAKDEWITTNTAIELLDAKSTILLRLPHITECLGGPSCLPLVPTVNVRLWLQVC